MIARSLTVGSSQEILGRFYLKSERSRASYLLAKRQKKAAAAQSQGYAWTASCLVRLACAVVPALQPKWLVRVRLGDAQGNFSTHDVIDQTADDFLPPPLKCRFA